MQWVEDYFGDAGRPELLPGSPAAKAKARIIMARCAWRGCSKQGSAPAGMDNGLSFVIALM